MSFGNLRYKGRRLCTVGACGIPTNFEMNLWRKHWGHNAAFTHQRKHTDAIEDRAMTRQQPAGGGGSQIKEKTTNDVREIAVVIWWRGI